MKSWRRWLQSTAAVVAISYCMSIPALAAEGAEPNPADTPAGVIFRWLNFALVFGGIAFLIAKHGGGFFGANAKAIAANITEAQAVKAAADRELSEVTVKMSRLDQDVETLQQSAHRDVAVESDRLRASAVVEVEKIKLAARAELAASERAAQQQLREVAAAMAVERAGELIISRMTQEVRSKLFSSFLGALERGTN